MRTVSKETLEDSEGFKMIAQNLCPPFGGQRPQVDLFLTFSIQMLKRISTRSRDRPKIELDQRRKNHLFLAKRVLCPSERRDIVRIVVLVGLIGLVGLFSLLCDIL